MRRFTIMLVMLAVLGVTTSVHAEESRGDGNELLEYCTDNSNTQTGAFKSGWCLGYLSGFKDNRVLVAPRSCVPDGVSVGQGQRIIVKYLQDHPIELHHEMGLLVARALYKAFPCPASPSPQ